MKFISKYSNDKEVTPAQYITEMICEKKAKSDKLDLHYKFWTSKKWAAYYRNQIATANKLVKEFDPIAIVKALNNPKAQRMYSLRAPFFRDIIKEEQEILESKNTVLTKQYERKDTVKHARPQNKSNIISKLKDIDNDS